MLKYSKITVWLVLIAEDGPIPTIKIVSELSEIDSHASATNKGKKYSNQSNYYKLSK